MNDLWPAFTEPHLGVTHWFSVRHTQRVRQSIVPNLRLVIVNRNPGNFFGRGWLRLSRETSCRYQNRGNSNEDRCRTPRKHVDIISMSSTRGMQLCAVSPPHKE